MADVQCVQRVWAPSLPCNSPTATGPLPTLALTLSQTSGGFQALSDCVNVQIHSDVTYNLKNMICSFIHHTETEQTPRTKQSKVSRPSCNLLRGHLIYNTPGSPISRITVVKPGCCSRRRRRRCYLWHVTGEPSPRPPRCKPNTRHREGDSAAHVYKAAGGGARANSWCVLRHCFHVFEVSLQETLIFLRHPPLWVWVESES